MNNYVSPAGVELPAPAVGVRLRRLTQTLVAAGRVLGRLAAVQVARGDRRDSALPRPLREAFEELGISRFTFKLKGKCIYNRTVSGRKENHYFIIYEIRSDEKPILNEESESFKKFSPKI